MGATRDKIYESFEKKKKKAKDLAPGRTGTNTDDGAGRETFTKPGNKGWKINTGPPQKKTPKPKHPGVMSYPTTKRPAGTADPGRTPNTAPSKKYDRTIRKATFGFGSKGTTTWVDLPKNPTAAEKTKGASMARNQTGKRGTAPQAKAPTSSGSKWGPQGPYRMPKETTKSFSSGSIVKAIAKTGATVAGAVALTGTAAALAATGAGRPKRNKSAAVEVAASRKAITTPTAPKIKAYTAGAKAQADPALKVASDKRRTAEGAKLKQAGYGQPKVKPIISTEKPKPRSILELEEPKAPISTERPAAPKATTTAPAAEAAPQPKPGRFQRLREAFMGQSEYSEVEASRKLAAKTAVTAPITTPVDTSVEVAEAKEQAKELEGKLKKAAKAPGRAAKKVASTTKRVVKTAAQRTAESVTIAATPADAQAEIDASKRAVKTPVDPPATAPGEFDELSPDERSAKRKELQERVARGQADQAAKAKKKAPTSSNETKVVEATPEEIAENKQRDLTRAKAEAEKQRTAIAKHEHEAANESTEQKLETTPDERRQGEQRTKVGRRDVPTRAKAGEVPVGSREGSWPPGPKQSSRRKQGSDRRGATPEIETPVVSDETKQLQKELDKARKENVKRGGSEVGKATPGPAVGNNAVTKVDGIPAAEPPKDRASGWKSTVDPKVKDQPAPPRDRASGWQSTVDPNLQRDIDKARKERRKTTTIRPGGKRGYDAPMTETEKAGVKAVTNPAAVAKKKQAALAQAEKDAKIKAEANAPADQAEMGRELEAAKKRSADLTAQVEAATVADTAEQTSRSATSSEATKVAGNEGFTPWSDEKLKSATPEEFEAYKSQLEKVVEGETSAEAANRKKATQKFYTAKGKRLEAQGSVRKGTSTAINPAVAGAPEAVETPVSRPAKRRSTEELMKEQGVEARQIPERKAPESDTTTEEWEKKKQNSEQAKKAARSPLEQAKLDAADIGMQISETEARVNSLGAKLKEAAGAPTDTLTADMANFEGQRVVQSRLNPEGEFETHILEGEGLQKTVAEAQEDLRKGQDRRTGDVTRRKLSERATIADASKMVLESDRPALPGEKTAPVGKKKGSRRDKQPGGDRRQKGSTWKPVNVAEEIANLRPDGGPERRGRSLMDLDVGELKDDAMRGDPIAKETLKQYQTELKGIGKERRATDTAGREAARLGLDIERAERGTPESTSTWDPKAKHPVPNAQMDVNADLMPEARIYSGDPVKANTLEKMNKNIDALQKRLKAPGAGVLHKGQETLDKMIRQRDGLSQEIEIAKTRQFPSTEASVAEQAVERGAKVVPRDESRKHVRGPDGRRNVLVEGTPQQRKTAAPKSPIAEPRTRPHVGPQRAGSVTIPAPDLTVEPRTAVDVDRAKFIPKQEPQWEKSLTQTKPLTSPAIGASYGENLWAAAKRGVKNIISKPGSKTKTTAGLIGGFGVGTALFAAPDIASAYVDTAGDNRDRIRALGEQSVESGIEVGGGLALFTGAIKGAQWLAPKVLKAPIGVAAHLGGAAVVGHVAGTAAGGIYNRVKRIREKNVRDTAHAQEKYGTVEAATRTRKGLKADGKPMTLDDTEELAKRWEREQSKLKKKRSK